MAKTLADLEAEIEADARKRAETFDAKKLAEKSKREPLPDLPKDWQFTEEDDDG